MKQEETDKIKCDMCKHKMSKKDSKIRIKRNVVLYVCEECYNHSVDSLY